MVLRVEARSSQRHLRSAGHRTDQQHAEVGHVLRRHAQRRAEQALEQARLGRAAGVPGAAGERRPYDGATRSVPLPVGVLTPSSKFGWCRTGLDWLHGALGRCRQFGPRSSPYTGWSAGRVAARLVGQRLEHDVQGEAAERLGLALAAVDQAAEQAGVLRGVAGEQLRLRPADLPEPDDVVAVLRAGSRGRCRRTT